MISLNVAKSSNIFWEWSVGVLEVVISIVVFLTKDQDIQKKYMNLRYVSKKIYAILGFRAIAKRLQLTTEFLYIIFH